MSSTPHSKETQSDRLPGLEERGILALMSKAEILVQLPNLGREDRREILERLWELEESELLEGANPTAEEKALLDCELEEYGRNPEAGSTWSEVENRLGTKKVQ